MKRVLISAALSLFAVVAASGIALAATPAEVADELDATGYYVEPGAENVDESALRDTMADAREADQRLGVAFLADDPAQGAFGFAEDALAASQRETVLVLSPDEVGAASAVHDDDIVQSALDRAAGDFGPGGDPAAGVATFVEELSVRAGGGTAVGQTGGGGIGTFGLLLFLGAVALLGGMTLMSSARQRRRLRARGQSDLATARAELRRQTQALADDVLAMSDRLSVADSADANAEYAKATEAYQAVLGTAEQAPSLAALAEVTDDLDRARWHLEAARAAAEGEEPRRTAASSACFFDAVHGAGSEEASLRAAGRDDLAVRVCANCAGVLRGGGHPAEHRVTVGMRELPVVMAPRGFGGAGLSWLSEFTLTPAGGQPVSFDWSRYGGRLPAATGKGQPSGGSSSSTPSPVHHRRRSGWGWGWGGGWGYGRSRRYGGYGGGWGGGWGGGTVPRGGSRGGGSVSRGVTRGGGSVSRGGARGGGSISRGGGSRGGGSRGGGSRGGGSRGGGSRRR